MQTEIGRTVEIDGRPTDLHDIGEGPPLLLIHGSGPGSMAWTNWRMIAPELARHFRVVAPDLLGFGHSARPAGARYDGAMWTRQLCGILDELRVPRAHVAGFSLGGALALMLASQHPERVAKLVLIGSLAWSFL